MRAILKYKTKISYLIKMLFFKNFENNDTKGLKLSTSKQFVC